MDKKTIEGYKIFNPDFTNRYGKKFQAGMTYQTSDKVKFGNDGKGFHLCLHLEDTFRYIDSKKGFVIAKVIGSGKIIEYNDEYYGYYDMYACEKIYIKKFLKRAEVIQIIIDSPQESIIRFIETCFLTPQEKSLFIKKFIDNAEILKYILYYQYREAKTFQMSPVDIKQLVKKIK